MAYNPGMRLTELHARITEIDQLPTEDTRLVALRALWPALVALAGDVAVGDETRINMITKAHRTLDVTAPRHSDPEVALFSLQRTLDMAGQ